jgi:hypothetical protein
VSILWGVLVYDEATRTGGWIVLAAVGGIAITAGVASLARSPVFAPDHTEASHQPARTTAAG